MKKNKIIQLFHALNEIKERLNREDVVGIKFKYAINKNSKAIENEIKVLQEIEGANDALIKPFSEARNELIMKLGKANENGSTSISQDDSEAMKEFTKGIEQLRIDYKESLDKYEEAMKEYAKFVESEDSDVIVYKMNIDECPDWLSMAQIELFTELEII